MAAEDGLKAQKLLAQGVWMQNTLFFQGVLDVTYDTPPTVYFFSLYIFTQSISIFTGNWDGSAFPTQLPSICISMSR